MKIKLLLTFLLITVYGLNATAQLTSLPNWTVSTIIAEGSNQLNYPHELTYGPDGWLWITERVGKKILRVNPADGTKETMLDLSSKVYQTAGQDGLMGMAIHPDLYADITTTTNNYVYVAYTYNSSGRKTRIARLKYNHGSTPTLTIDTGFAPNGTLIDGLPASNDHNSGRLIIGPDFKLYYSIGDLGANQFGNACNPILAQVIPSQAEVDIEDYTNYPGKLLRLNLDGTIPSDNPTLGGVQSHVYTYGHRNHQGLVFAANGDLYNSEHGAKVDDEINKIVAGGNYGWPEIAGYYDNQSYTYCNWAASTPNCNSSYFSDHNCPGDGDNYGGRTTTSNTEFQSYPTAGDLPSNFKPPIGTYGSTVNSSYNSSGGWLTWSTVAPSSIDIYEAGLIPGWGKSLLITTLKEGTIFRAKLTASGDDIDGDPDGLTGAKTGYEVFLSGNTRFRDVAMDPDGLNIYAVTDTGGTTSGPSGSSSVPLTNAGELIKITYTGPTASVEDEILKEFQLYPNPVAEGNLSVIVPIKIEVFEIRISNTIGQQIYVEKKQNNSARHKVDLGQLKRGIYFVTIQSNSGKATKKLVVQ
jgi:PQQ-dependent dehydrogenase (s-GDH family)